MDWTGAQRDRQTNNVLISKSGRNTFGALWSMVVGRTRAGLSGLEWVWGGSGVDRSGTVTTMPPCSSQEQEGAGRSRKEQEQE